MKTWLAILFLCTLPLEAEIEFSGFFGEADDTQFLLSDTDTKESSRWLKIGQSFGGYTILSFDRSSELVTLKISERVMEIRLRGSKVRDQAEPELLPHTSVHVAQDGMLRIDDRTVSIGEFFSWATRARQQNQALAVKLFTAPNVDMKLVRAFFDACRASGITRISISTSSDKMPNQASEPTAAAGRGSP